MIKIKKKFTNKNKTFCPFCSLKLRQRFVEGRNRLFCLKCQTPLYENPIPASCVILINTLDQVLLVKRKVDPQKGHWCLPGGFIETGETPEQAAERELKEETGLKGKVESLIGVSSSSEVALHSIVIIGYLVKNYSGVLKAGDDALETRFFNRHTMPKIAFESHSEFITTSYSRGLY